MKNRLEDEYRQLMQNETPDLWERISAGIDAKIAADKRAEDEVEVDNETEKTAGVVVSMNAEHPVKIKKQGVNFWKKYSLPLVACIAAILCVPLMVTGFLRMAGGGSKSETAEADMAVAEESYFTTTEAEDAPAEEYFEEAVMEEAAAEEAPAEAPESAMDEEATDGTMDNLAQDTAENFMGEKAETETESNAMQESAESEQELLDLEKEKEELTQILTVITFSAEEGVLDEERAKGSIYYLTTVEQGECTVFVPSDLAFVIELNQQLIIVVEEGNDDYDYVFVKVVE